MNFNKLAATFLFTAISVNAHSTINTTSSGIYNSVVINDNGKAFAMGKCVNGECGTGSNKSYQLTPVHTGMTNVRSVDQGFSTVVYVTHNGEVFYHGASRSQYQFSGSASATKTPTQLIFPGEVIDHSVEDWKAYFIVKTKEVNNVSAGQLYVWDLEPNSLPTPVSNHDNLIMLTSGSTFTAALDVNGDVYTWGQYTTTNGDGTTEVRTAPSDQPNVTGLNLTYISAGTYHIAAIDVNNDVWTWGHGGDGKLGNGTNGSEKYPFQATGFGKVKQISSYDNTTVAKSVDGKLKTVGWHNLIYQGTGYNKDYYVQTVSFDKEVVDVGAGRSDSRMIKDIDGNVWSWSGNRYGKLGLGHDTELHKLTQLNPEIIEVNQEPEIVVVDQYTETVTDTQIHTSDPVIVNVETTQHTNQVDNVIQIWETTTTTYEVTTITVTSTTDTTYTVYSDNSTVSVESDPVFTENVEIETYTTSETVLVDEQKTNNRGGIGNNVSTEDCGPDHDKGHGNDCDKFDEDNPNKGNKGNKK